MAEISKYVVYDEDGNDAMGHEIDTYAEAEVRAKVLAGKSPGHEYAVVEYVYEFADTSLVFTTNGSETWPPRGEGES